MDNRESAMGDAVSSTSALSDALDRLGLRGSALVAGTSVNAICRNTHRGLARKKYGYHILKRHPEVKER